MWTCLFIHPPICSHLPAPAYLHAHVFTLCYILDTDLHIHIHVCIHKHKQTCIHTCMHTHIHIYIDNHKHMSQKNTAVIHGSIIIHRSSSTGCPSIIQPDPPIIIQHHLPSICHYHNSMFPFTCIHDTNMHTNLHVSRHAFKHPFIHSSTQTCFCLYQRWHDVMSQYIAYHCIALRIMLEQ